MKKIFVILIVLFTGVVFAQDKPDSSGVDSTKVIKVEDLQKRLGQLQQLAEKLTQEYALTKYVYDERMRLINIEVQSLQTILRGNVYIGWGFLPDKK